MNKRLAATIGGVALLSLAMVGCSSGTPQGSDDGNGLEQVKERGYINFGVKYDSPPFSALNTGTNEPEGFDVDLAKALAGSILGDSEAVRFTKVGTDSRIPMLEQGQVDLVLATMVITPERMEQIDFSDPYYPADYGVIVTADSPIKSNEDLAGTTNCITTGSIAQTAMLDGLQAEFGDDFVFDSVSLDSYPACVLAVKQGRADFVGTTAGILFGLAAGDDELTIPQGVSVPGEPWGIGVKKGEDELTTAVNDALADVFGNGTWAELYTEWTGFDLPAGWPPAS